MKKTLVIGASENPERYSNKVIRRLVNNGIPVVALGLKEGLVDGVKIIKGKPEVHDIHTVTMYVGMKNQADLVDYIFSLNPKRIIFNPGAENPEFMNAALDKGIEAFEACTLTMLSIGAF